MRFATISFFALLAASTSVVASPFHSAQATTDNVAAARDLAIAARDLADFLETRAIAIDKIMEARSMFDDGIGDLSARAGTRAQTAEINAAKARLTTANSNLAAVQRTSEAGMTEQQKAQLRQRLIAAQNARATAIAAVQALERQYP